MFLFFFSVLFSNYNRSVLFICTFYIFLQSTAAGESGARGARAAPRAESVSGVGTAHVTHPGHPRTGILALGRVSPTIFVLISNASTIHLFIKKDVITMIC